MYLLPTPFLVSLALDPPCPWRSPGGSRKCTTTVHFHCVQSGLSSSWCISLAAPPWRQAVDLPDKHSMLDLQGIQRAYNPLLSYILEEEAQSDKVMWPSNFGIKPRASTVLVPHHCTTPPPPPPASLSVERAEFPEAFLSQIASVFLLFCLTGREGRAQGLASGHSPWGSLRPNLPLCSGCRSRAAP